MSEDIHLSLSHDEALVLFGFFARFNDDDGFALRHNAEFVAFMKISAQIDKSLVEPFKLEYLDLLQAARERVAAGYERKAPGVHEGEG
jgi:hypothetical protein